MKDYFAVVNGYDIIYIAKQEIVMHSSNYESNKRRNKKPNKKKMTDEEKFHQKLFGKIKRNSSLSQRLIQSVFYEDDAGKIVSLKFEDDFYLHIFMQCVCFNRHITYMSDKAGTLDLLPKDTMALLNVILSDFQDGVPYVTIFFNEVPSLAWKHSGKKAVKMPENGMKVCEFLENAFNNGKNPKYSFISEQPIWC